MKETLKYVAETHNVRQTDLLVPKQPQSNICSVSFVVIIVMLVRGIEFGLSSISLLCPGSDTRHRPMVVCSDWDSPWGWTGLLNGLGLTDRRKQNHVIQIPDGSWLN
jgi:hypothetical protein